MTELLSNVHRHARPDKSCTVELELRPDRLTVSVRDHDPRLPVPADDADRDTEDSTPLATCGRGLAMVAAVSESWGARPDGDNGKVVWFTLPATPGVPARVPCRTPEHQPTPTPVTAGVVSTATPATPPRAPVPAAVTTAPGGQELAAGHPVAAGTG